VWCRLNLTCAKAESCVPHHNTAGSAGGTGVGNFGRFKAQKIRSLVTRSAQLKRGEGSDRSSTNNRFDEPSFDDSDGEESYSERRRPVSVSVSGSARHARQKNSNSGNGRTRGGHSLNSVLSRYKGDDPDSPGSKATSGSRGWGDVADVTHGRQNQRQREPLEFPKRKGPLDGGFFSRRSFKEIGCSDEILGALRNFDFPRPSHIQVKKKTEQFRDTP
jgi:ATP-dependent RNA helicase DDX18/HAS1